MACHNAPSADTCITPHAAHTVIGTDGNGAALDPMRGGVVDDVGAHAATANTRKAKLHRLSGTS